MNFFLLINESLRVSLEGRRDFSRARIHCHMFLKNLDKFSRAQNSSKTFDNDRFAYHYLKIFSSSIQIYAFDSSKTINKEAAKPRCKNKKVFIMRKMLSNDRLFIE